MSVNQKQGLVEQFKGRISRIFSFMKDEEFEEFLKGKTIEIRLWPFDEKRKNLKLFINLKDGDNGQEN